MNFSHLRPIVRFICASACALALQAGMFSTLSDAQEIRTPPPAPTPRVNGPTIFGVTPGSDFIYKIPATGDGTLTYSVDNLPAGLTVNPTTGMISGTITNPAYNTYNVTLRATNNLGSNEKPFRIVVGDTIALTPPLGWNSWNAWGSNIDSSKWLAAAHGMVDSGLINHGWTYINIDDGWQANVNPVRGGPFNSLQSNSRFADMQAIADEIHSVNLKVGIYSSPWIQTYAGYPGGSADNPQGNWTKTSVTSEARKEGAYTFEVNDASQWAVWGIDYLKYDWNPTQTTPPTTTEQFQAQTQRMQQALRNSGRDVVYSYSNSMPFTEVANQAPMLNAWRTTGDINDTWSSMSSKGFTQDRWAPYQSPGHWNDTDMMVVGYCKWGPTGSGGGPSRLTYDEQYTHVSLWSILSVPMLLGNRMEYLSNDPFTLNLLTNDEILEVNQDALGIMGTTKAGAGTNLRVYVKEMEDGSKTVGLFNVGSTAASITANWFDVGVAGSQRVRDLWRQYDIGEFDDQFSMTVAPHGAEMVRLFPLPTVPGVNWEGDGTPDATNWGLAANWNSGAVPDGAGVKVTLGDQTPASAVVDMVTVGRTVGNIELGDSANFTIRSSGGHNLTMDNNGHSSLIRVEGTHSITAPLILNNNVSIKGPGTLNVLNRISGAYGLGLQSGILNLNVANDYLGATSIYDGKIQINGDNLLPYGPGKGNVSLSSLTAVLEMNNHNLNINAINGSGGSIKNSGVSGKSLTIGNGDASGSFLGTIDGKLSLTKVGSGTQALGGANTFDGQTTVAAGTLKAANALALGSNAVGTSILNGGTLDVNALNLGTERITAQGSGAEGFGAIINSGASQQNAVRYLTLSGNTTVGGAGRWDIRGSGASLSTNGQAYSLTKVGNNQISLAGITVDSALANVNIDEGILSLETSTTGLGTPTGTLNVAPGATLQLYRLSTPLNKKVVLNGGAIYALSSTSSSENTISGNLIIGSGGGTLSTGSSSAELTINCSITGSSSLFKTGMGKVTLAKTNIFTGTTYLLDGELAVNGYLAGGINMSPNYDSYMPTTLSGTGTVYGTVQDAATEFYPTIISPGAANEAGTLTLKNLNLNGYGRINLDLGSDPATNNDLLKLTGNLSLAGLSTTTLSINKLQGQLATGTYHLIQYGTAPSGATSYFTVAGLITGGRQTYSLQQDISNKYINLAVGGSPSAYLSWRGQITSDWDLIQTPNWLNGSSTDMFYNVDHVYFDDSGSPTVDIMAPVMPESVTVDINSKNYTFGGLGFITGPGGLLKQGSGTMVLANSHENDYSGTTYIFGGALQIGNGVNYGTSLGGTSGSKYVWNDSKLVFNQPDANTSADVYIFGAGSLEKKNAASTLSLNRSNDYDGDTIVSAGVLKIGASSALGSTASGTTIASGATLDLNGYGLGQEAITVKGNGAGGIGAIINSSTQQTTAVNKVILSGNTTFGGNTLPPGGSGWGRWDFRGTGNTLGTNGASYSLTKVGLNQVSFVATTIDNAVGASLANITINQGILAFQTSTTSMGDPTKTLTIGPSGILNFYGTTNPLYKICQVNGGTIWAESGASQFTGPITVNSAGGILDAGSSLTGGGAKTSYLYLTGPISGTGGITKNGPGTVYLWSAPSYNGNTIINDGTLDISSAPADLNAVSGAGKLSIGVEILPTQISVDSIHIGTLAIAAGSKLTIAPRAGGPLAATLAPVPEPSAWIMLALATVGLGLYYRRSR